MRRTEQLQGLRLMKFDEVYGRTYRGELSQLEAAEILGMSERTFRRWRDRFEAEGAEGLYDRRLGRVRSARLAMFWVIAILTPPGFTPRLICRRYVPWPCRGREVRDEHAARGRP